MRYFRMAATCLLTAALLPLAACGTKTASGADPGSAPTGTAVAATATAAGATLPKLTGFGLPAAMDAAGLAGFGDVSTHDATGAERPETVDADWQVCFQHPDPGTVALGTHVELGIVKATEECPAADRTTRTAGSTTTKTARTVRIATTSGTSATSPR
ncbi:MAG TPA: hypothetical protein VGL02_00295 [Streptomyces sp.]